MSDEAAAFRDEAKHICGCCGCEGRLREASGGTPLTAVRLQAGRHTVPDGVMIPQPGDSTSTSSSSVEEVETAYDVAPLAVQGGDITWPVEDATIDGEVGHEGDHRGAAMCKVCHEGGDEGGSTTIAGEKDRHDGGGSAEGGNEGSNDGPTMTNVFHEGDDNVGATVDVGEVCGDYVEATATDGHEGGDDGASMANVGNKGNNEGGSTADAGDEGRHDEGGGNDDPSMSNVGDEVGDNVGAPIDDGEVGDDDGGATTNDGVALRRSTRCKKKSFTLSTPYTVAHGRTRSRKKDTP